MSDRYELFKVEPCPCDGSGYERVLGRDNEEIVIDCSLCAGDGSRRVPTGRIVEQASVWDVPDHRPLGYDSDGRVFECAQCGEPWPCETSERMTVYYEDEERPDDARPMFVEVTDDAES